MPKIPLAALIAMNPADGDRINFFTWFYSMFDNAQAAHKTITNVEPLYYQGAIAGTEFLTYAATKLYISLNLKIGGSSSPQLNANYIDFYSEADAVFFRAARSSVLWDVTAASIKLSRQLMILKNVYFSRIAAFSYDYMTFNGYRVTLN